MDDNPLLAQADEALSRVQPTLIDQANGALLGVPAEHARAAIVQRAVDEHKQRFESRGAWGQASQFIGENMAPFISPAVNAKWAGMVGESVDRINRGEYSDEDLGRMAYQHVRDEAAGQQGIGRQLVGAAGKAVGLVGEAVLSGPVGRIVPGGQGAVGATLAGTGRLAVQTAAMPSLYVEAAQQRAQQQGGSGLGAQNLGPAFVEGMITNKILGSLGKPGEALASRVPNPAGRIAARAAVGGVLMPAEQQLADTATSVADEVLPQAYKFNTHYGALGDLLNGKKGEAGRHFALQAITGAAFAAVHTPGKEAERQAAMADELTRVNAKLLAMSRRGGSSQRVFDTLTGELAGERQAQIAQLTKQPAGKAPSAPGATPPTAQPTLQEPRQGTIAPKPATSTPPVAPEAPAAIPTSEKPLGAAPTAEQVAESFWQGATDNGRVMMAGEGPGPAPLDMAGMRDLAASLGMKTVPEYQRWKVKNPAAAEALERAARGEKPAEAPQQKAAFEPAKAEGPFTHPEFGDGGPRLLAELRAAPEYRAIAGNVPEGSKPIGKPNDAFVWERPDGKIVRVGQARERPNIPQMIQPESVQRHGRFMVEVLPKVERVGDVDYFNAHKAELIAAVEAMGYRPSDLHRENVGEYQGRPVFVDPTSVRKATPRESQVLAARSSPPEPAAAPGAFPSPETRKDLFGGGERVFPAGSKVQQQGMFNAATGTTDAWQSPLHAKAAELGKPIQRMVQGGAGGEALIDGKLYETFKDENGQWDARPKDQSKYEKRARTVKDRYGIDVNAEAKELGVPLETYHQLADHNLKLQNERNDEHNQLVKDALESLDKNARRRGAKGSKARFIAANEAKAGKNRTEDAPMLNRDGIDNVAEQSAEDYPGQYRDVAGDKEHLTDQLFEKLREGKRKPDVKEAYRAAYAELESANKEFKDAQAGPGITDARRKAIVDGGEAAANAHARGDAHDTDLSAHGFDFPFGAEDQAQGPAPGQEQARPSNGRAQAPANPNAAAGQADVVGAAPTRLDKLRAGKKDAAAQPQPKRAKLGGASEPMPEESEPAKEGTSLRADFEEHVAKSDLSQRDKRIVAGLLDGKPASQIIRETGLSDQRIYDIGDAAAKSFGRGFQDAQHPMTELLAHMGTAEKRMAEAKVVSPADQGRDFGLVGGGQEGDGRPGHKERMTALANEMVDRERAANGLPPLMRAARQSNPETWDRAMSMLDADPEAGVKMVADLARNPRATTVEENALLLHRKITLSNDLDRAARDYTAAMHPSRRAGFSAEQLDAMEKRFDGVLKQIDELDLVTRSTGTEWGRAGQFRRQLAAEDYSLAGMLQKAVAAKGRPLTPEERALIIEQQQKIADLQKRLDQSEDRFRTEAGKTVATVERGRQAEVVATSPTLKEMLGLRAQSERAKGDFRQQLAKDVQARQPLSKRMTDFLIKLRQAMVISSPKTMAKIVAASLQRIVIAPMEEAVGAGLRQIPGIQQIAALAPREGQGFSLGRERRAFVSAFTDGMRDAWHTVRTGRSNLDATYLGTADPRSWLDFVGEMHAAAKAPAVRAEYTRSFLSRLNAEASKGVDISNPLVVQKAGIEAYKDSQRAKFQQDNAIVDAYNKAVNNLRKPEAGTGANVVGAGLKVALPVVHIPSNIVAEVGEYAFGTVLGSVKAARAWKLGVDSLKPAEAETIMRQLKKGSIGGAALLMGYFAPQVFGGFRQRDEKRKPGELQPMEVQTPVGAAPSWTQHNPLLEVFQVGATARKVQDSFRKGETKGLGEGAIESLLGLAEEAPFVRETTEVDKLLNPKTRGYWFGEFMKSLAIPQAVTWLAGNLDRNAEGEAVKRKPGSTLEHIATGIPGARQSVPERQPAKPRR